MDTHVLTQTSTSSALQVDAPSLWTVLALGMSSIPAPTIRTLTQTISADSTRSLLLLPTMGSLAHAWMPSSSAPTMVVPSLWTVRGPGRKRVLALMTRSLARTQLVTALECSLLLRTTARSVPSRRGTCHALRRAVISRWTVSASGLTMASAACPRILGSTPGAACTMWSEPLRTTERSAPMSRTLRPAPPAGASRLLRLRRQPLETPLSSLTTVSPVMTGAASPLATARTRTVLVWTPSPPRTAP